MQFLAQPRRRTFRQATPNQRNRQNLQPYKPLKKYTNTRRLQM
jgi:hypothetical protein